MKGSGPVVVSACLLGARCRWDGTDRDDPAVHRWLGGRPAVAVCPEELGGLGTPRPPADLRGGDGAAVWTGSARVVTRDGGEERTEAFRAGAREALRAARSSGAREALLKEGSPSCGVRAAVRDGIRRPGRGVFAALLAAEGFSLRSEEDLGASGERRGR